MSCRGSSFWSHARSGPQAATFEAFVRFQHGKSQLVLLGAMVSYPPRKGLDSYLFAVKRRLKFSTRRNLPRLWPRCRIAKMRRFANLGIRGRIFRLSDIFRIYGLFLLGKPCGFR